MHDDNKKIWFGKDKDEKIIKYENKMVVYIYKTRTNISHQNNLKLKKD